MDTKRLFLTISLGWLLFLGGACASASSGEQPAVDPAPATATVTMEDGAFRPNTIEVAPGTTVVFVNEDDAPHTVDFESGGPAGSDVLEAGDRHAVTLDEAGTFAYSCSLHPEMTGTITVG